MSSVESDQSPRSPSRRNFIRLLGVAGGAAAVGASPMSPVKESEAIAPAVVAAGVGASIAAGWLLRETEVVGSDAPPEGLTGDVLRTEVYNTARARQSNNKSTFVDNKNILDGFKNAAYADAKVASIDSLNKENSQSDVTTAGVQEVNAYEETVLTNLARSWNESVKEFKNIIQKLRDHPDIGVGDAIEYFAGHGYRTGNVQFNFTTTDVTLESGKTLQLETIDYSRGDQDGAKWTLNEVMYEKDVDDGTNIYKHEADIRVINPAGAESSDNVAYLQTSEWRPIWDEITTYAQDVRDGLTTWVDGVYSDVQAGELDTGELLTPREQAELTADQEDFPQAIADLEALNVAVDYERQATIYIPNRDATLVGRLSYSGDTSFSVGTVDPDATDDNGDPVYPGSIYFTYDLAEGSGNWSDYETGIDGGILTFTAEPYEDTRYTVQTVAGESVELVAGNFTHDDAAGVWTVDLSDQLDTSITDVDYVDYAADVDGTKYETIQLTETFEIQSFTNTETGEEHEQTNFERSEPQTDDNYITEEEWKQQQERHEELIEKYEDAQGGGGIDLGQFDMFGLPGEVVALVVAGLAVLGISN